MKQTNLDEFNYITWEVVEKEIERNTSDRINWKEYLNMSLSKAINLIRANGMDADFCYNELCKVHPEFTYEMKRKLRIGISARYGEQKSAENVKKLNN